MESSHPRVSAIIPTYNYAQFVCEAVESALAQTWPNMEVIVVDDGSTDDTRERLQRYTGRIKYLYQNNRGLSAARNTGIREASGEYVAFLDSDDIWLPDKIEAQMQLVLTNGFEAVVCHPRLPTGRALTFDECFTVSPGFGSTALVRKTLFEEVGGFDESLRSVEDRDMMLRLTRGGRRIGVVGGAQVRIRQHAISMSRKAERMEQSFRAVLDKAFSWPEARSPLLRHRAMAFFYRDGAHAYLDEGRPGIALDRILRSFLAWPLPLGRPTGRPLERLRMLAWLPIRAMRGRRAAGPISTSGLAGDKNG